MRPSQEAGVRLGARTPRTLPDQPFKAVNIEHLNYAPFSGLRARALLRAAQYPFCIIGVRVRLPYGGKPISSVNGNTFWLRRLAAISAVALHGQSDTRKG